MQRYRDAHGHGVSLADHPRITYLFRILRVPQPQIDSNSKLWSSYGYASQCRNRDNTIWYNRQIHRYNSTFGSDDSHQSCSHLARKNERLFANTRVHTWKRVLLQHCRWFVTKLGMPRYQNHDIRVITFVIAYLWNILLDTYLARWGAYVGAAWYCKTLGTSLPLVTFPLLKVRLQIIPSLTLPDPVSPITRIKQFCELPFF